MTKAALLIGGPIVIGVLYFLAVAPRQEVGVYVETSAGMYALSMDSSRDRLSRDVLSHAPAVAGDAVVSFFILAPEGSALSESARSAGVCLFVVGPGTSDVPSTCKPLPTSVTRVHPRLYHVTAEGLRLWGRDSAAFNMYRQSLERTASPRARLEVMVALVLPLAQEPSRMYSVRLGPPAARITDQLTLARR